MDSSLLRAHRRTGGVITATQIPGRASKWFDNEAGPPAEKGTAGALTGVVSGWITDAARTSQSGQTVPATAVRIGTETGMTIDIVKAMDGTAETETETETQPAA